MKEILPGVFHWTTFHEGIGQEVESYFLAETDPPVALDPRVPEEGLDWFDQHPQPRHVLLTNRLHYRHSSRFAERFGSQVWCHRSGMHEFGDEDPVRPFEHGDELPGGILACKTNAICPEETAFFIPRSDGILAIGDAILVDDGELTFMPDSLLGDNPGRVKDALRHNLREHLRLDFEHLLMAHAKPIIGDAKARLRRFLEQPD